MKRIWKVRDTPMYPCRYQVYPTCKYQERNDRYFEHKEDAQREAARLNKQEEESNAR